MKNYFKIFSISKFSHCPKIENVPFKDHPTTKSVGYESGGKHFVSNEKEFFVFLHNHSADDAKGYRRWLIKCLLYVFSATMTLSIVITMEAMKKRDGRNLWHEW